MSKVISLTIGIFLASATFSGANSLLSSPIDRLETRSREAVTVLDQYMETFENSIPEALLEKAECIFVVPSIVKVGFIFGVKTGKGLLSCRTERGWSNPMFTNITGGSIGFQVGVSVSDAVLIFTNRDAMNLLADGTLTLGVNASIAVGPLGRDAQAGTDGFKSAVYSYSRSKGLFVGISLGGSGIGPSTSDNETAYGAGVSGLHILTSIDSAPPAIVREFIGRLERYSPARH